MTPGEVPQAIEKLMNPETDELSEFIMRLPVGAVITIGSSDNCDIVYKDLPMPDEFIQIRVVGHWRFGEKHLMIRNIGPEGSEITVNGQKLQVDTSDEWSTYAVVELCKKKKEIETEIFWKVGNQPFYMNFKFIDEIQVMGLSDNAVEKLDAVKVISLKELTVSQILEVWIERVREDIGAKSVIGVKNKDMRKPTQDGLWIGEQGELAVVDGMGGSKGSEWLVKAILEAFARFQGETVEMLMAVADKFANFIREEGFKAKVVDAGAGAACILAKVYDQLKEVFIAQMGDARALLIRDGQVLQATYADSAPGVWWGTGIIPESEVRTHALKHQIEEGRVLGHGKCERGEEIPSMHIWRYQKGDRLVLCCDGLWEYIESDEELARIVCEAATPQDAAEELVRIALENGSEDDITVIVVQL